MITVNVTNFRGCATARLECAPIALLGGLNAAGKSSIAQAVGAALSGATLPISGMRANAAGALVRSGAAAASVEVSTENGSAMVEWPSARKTTGGRAPEASVYAVGIESVALMPAKDRLRILSEYLHAEPTADDLAQAMADAGLPASGEAFDRLWGLTEAQGWDGAVAFRRERGAQMKGQWRQITGANYGSRIAASWRPDLAELREPELVEEAATAKRERDNALTAEAVSDAERQRLESEADLLEARRDALGRAQERVKEYEAAYQQAQEARAALPPADRQEGFPCPHCGALIVAVKVSLAETRYEQAPVVKSDDAELRRRRMAIAEAEGKLSHASAELQQARRDVASAEASIRDSLAAQAKLDAWPRARESGAADRAAAEARLARAEKRLDEYRAKAEADRLHALIEGNEIVIALLAGDGLRAKKLASRLAVFNAALAEHCALARWPTVRLDDDGGMSCGDRPYALLSSSEQYRVRAVLAVEMARLDGSAMVVLDGADILDAPSRGGLLSLLASVALPALVCTTVARPDQLPDLEAAGAGRSYWLAAGVVSPIPSKRAAD
jgi:hypothetical protein